MTIKHNKKITIRCATKYASYMRGWLSNIVSCPIACKKPCIAVKSVLAKQVYSLSSIHVFSNELLIYTTWLVEEKRSWRKENKIWTKFQGALLVRDNHVWNGPLSCSLRLFARTAHSAHSLHSAPPWYSVYRVAHSLHSLPCGTIEIQGKWKCVYCHH